LFYLFLEWRKRGGEQKKNRSVKRRPKKKTQALGSTLLSVPEEKKLGDGHVGGAGDGKGRGKHARRYPFI